MLVTDLSSPNATPYAPALSLTLTTYFCVDGVVTRPKLALKRTVYVPGARFENEKLVVPPAVEDGSAGYSCTPLLFRSSHAVPLCDGDSLASSAPFWFKST